MARDPVAVSAGRRAAAPARAARNGKKGEAHAAAKNAARPARARQTGEQTRNDLLKAAEAVFGRKGYQRSTVDDIVQRAHVSRGTFYLHFRNKDDVFERLITEVVERMRAIPPLPHGGSLRDRVRAGNRQYLEVFRAHSAVLRSLFQASSNPRVAQMHAELRGRFILSIAAHLGRDARRTRIAAPDIAPASYALGMMVEGVAFSWLAEGFQPFDTPLQFDEMLEVLTDAWCRAVYRE